MTDSDLTGSPREEASGFTLRAFFIGMFFVLCIAVLVPHNIIYVASSELATRAFPMGAAAAFLLCIFAGNMLMRKIIPALVLKSREILVIFTMVLIACVFPGIGLMMYVGTIAGPAEYGTPNNKYFDTIFKGVDRLCIKDEADGRIRPLLKEELYALKEAYAEGASKKPLRRAYFKVSENVAFEDGQPVDPEKAQTFDAFLADNEFKQAPWNWAVPFNSVEAKSIEGPLDELDYMFKGFPPRYNGPETRQIVMSTWFKPLMWWTAFLLSMCVMVFCAMTILRKQWVEKERLLFPIMRVPMELVEGLDGKEKGSTPLIRNRLLWIGAMIPLIFMTWRYVSHHSGLIPQLPHGSHSAWGIAGGLNYFENTAETALAIIFPVIGFTFLINLDVSFSLWFFHIIGFIETGELNKRAIGGSAGSDYYSSGHPFVNHQGMGGVIALVLIGLWIGRKHIKAVFCKAFGRTVEGLDDRDEPLSYRMAVILLIASGLFCTGWMVVAGMSIWAAAAFMLLSLILYIGATRVVCEGGIVFVQACMIPQTFMLRTFGAKALGPANLVLMGLSFMWMADFTSVFMPNIANSMRLQDASSPGRKKWLLPTTLIVTLVILFVTGSLLFSISYKLAKRGGDYGWYFGEGGHIGWAMKYAVSPIDELNKAENREREEENWYRAAAQRWPFDNYSYADFEKNVFAPNEKAQYYGTIKMEQHLTHGVQPTRMVYTVLGFGFMSFLMLMRNRFVWWPLHPIGFPFASAPSTRRIWFSVFIGWLIKLLIIKYGGAKLFNKIKPVFIGLIVGAVIGVAVFYALDMIMFATENFDKGCGLSG
ncbi:DUF6785 family protein [Planctomycetota bacterium]